MNFSILEYFYRIFLFLLFSNGILHAEDLNQLEIAVFLNHIASAENDNWQEVISTLQDEYPHLLCGSSVGKALSLLNQKILKSDDLHLIKLFHRAVRNHDSLSSEKTDPFTFYYKHYQSPDFFVPYIHLTFDVTETHVLVTTDLTIRRNSGESTLILDGQGHKVLHVKINGCLITKDLYKITPHELILHEIPKEDTFQVQINSEIDPFTNKSLLGMYQCQQWLTTQCESEGARRIFYTIDRPDVLSKITTTIIADKNRYPYRLSNGEFVNEVQLENGRCKITWEDPFPKPSYLFACVLGNFSLLKSDYTSKGGNLIELQIYVEPGKESRAHFALIALKKAMQFDELFFDRQYDLSCLKMVAIPDFNSGAMENKGLMIFNDIRLLVDSNSGTDLTHREVATVIAHEYFHNWSGNRVTIRNWFEIALKESFTDLKAILFSEWLFGEEFIRPKSVIALMENQFPEETSEKGHPIIAESYVDPLSIYDETTYLKGREVFRVLKTYIDMLIPDGFRQMQNLYFSNYDGQAVTFRELLAAGNEVCRQNGKDLKNFEQWFLQQGTPVVSANLTYNFDEKIAEITVKQSCKHPKTGILQEPLLIPFSIELIGTNGVTLHPKFSQILEDETTTFRIQSQEMPIPIFLHGYSAPVILEYDYSMDDLACIATHSDDSFCRWEAAQKYSILALKKMIDRIRENQLSESIAENGQIILADLQQFYVNALNSSKLSPLSKAQILEIPSLRVLSQALNCYDFERLNVYRELFINQLAIFCKPHLENMLKVYPAQKDYEPLPEQMQIRELRNACFWLLVHADEKYQKVIFERYLSASNFDDAVSSFILCQIMGGPYREIVIADFYTKWKNDKAVFNFWLTSQALSHECTPDDLIRLEAVEGFDVKNPNHICSIYRAYLANLHCYHNSNGEGYRLITDKIIEISKFNPSLSHNYLAVPAFIDFERLPNRQQELMVKELMRLQNHEQVPAETRDLAGKILQRYCEKNNTR